MSDRHSTNSVNFSLDFAVQLNNEGVRQTLAGRDKQAVALFSKALAMLNAVLLSAEPSNGQSDCSLILHDSTAKLPKFEENGKRLFNSVITLTRRVGYSTAAVQVYCSTILLNIALVYHRQAVTGGQESLLVKAERFYERAIEIAPSGDELRYSCGSTTGIMTKLAAVNNLSQIQGAVRGVDGYYQTTEKGFVHAVNTTKQQKLVA